VKTDSCGHFSAWVAQLKTAPYELADAKTERERKKILHFLKLCARLSRSSLQSSLLAQGWCKLREERTVLVFSS